METADCFSTASLVISKPESVTSLINVHRLTDISCAHHSNNQERPTSNESCTTQSLESVSAWPGHSSDLPTMLVQDDDEPACDPLFSDPSPATNQSPVSVADPLEQLAKGADTLYMPGVQLIDTELKPTAQGDRVATPSSSHVSDMQLQVRSPLPWETESALVVQQKMRARELEIAQRTKERLENLPPQDRRMFDLSAKGNSLLLNRPPITRAANHNVASTTEAHRQGSADYVPGYPREIIPNDEDIRNRTVIILRRDRASGTWNKIETKQLTDAELHQFDMEYAKQRKQ